jgi:hypothetical protein
MSRSGEFVIMTNDTFLCQDFAMLHQYRQGDASDE